MPGDSLQRGTGDFDQSRDDDEDVDRRPAYDEDGDHHQDHAGDPTQVPVLLLCVCGGGRWCSVGDKKEHKMSVGETERKGGEGEGGKEKDRGREGDRRERMERSGSICICTKCILLRMRTCFLVPVSGTFPRILSVKLLLLGHFTFSCNSLKLSHNLRLKWIFPNCFLLRATSAPYLHACSGVAFYCASLF